MEMPVIDFSKLPDEAFNKYNLKAVLDLLTTIYPEVVVEQGRESVFDSLTEQTISRYASWFEYSLSKNESDELVERMISTIRGVGIDEGSGYYGLKSFSVDGEQFNLYCEVSKEQTDGNVYYTVYYAIEYDEGDTLFSDWTHTELMDLDKLKKLVYQIASVDYSKDVQQYVANGRKPSTFIFDDELYFGQDEARETIDGYLLAMDTLVNRMVDVVKNEHSPETMETFDNINFYPIYNLRSGDVKVEGTYYYDDGCGEKQGEFELPLSLDEQGDLIKAMNSYCQKLYGKPCLEELNSFRADEGMKPLILKLPLSCVISGAEATRNKQDITDKSLLNIIKQRQV